MEWIKILQSTFTVILYGNDHFMNYTYISSEEHVVVLSHGGAVVCLIYPGFWCDTSIRNLHIDWLVECEWLVWIIWTGIAFIFALFWKCLLNHWANISLEMGFIYLHKVCTHFFFPLEQVAAWCPSCCSVTAEHGWQKNPQKRQKNIQYREDPLIGFDWVLTWLCYGWSIHWRKWSEVTNPAHILTSVFFLSILWNMCICASARTYICSSGKW